MSGQSSAFVGHDDHAASLRMLAEGDLTVEGRLVTASNATLYCRVESEDGIAHCVYKPVAGERPLWDFPDGTLARRERAAYLLSEASGWRLVPPTLLRDGPFGPGMCQLWIEALTDADLVDVVPRDRVPAGWLGVFNAQDQDGRSVTLTHADDPRLRRMALLDIVMNNADRKGGHVLVTSDGRLQGVDHGVCFHEDDKLRTVLWGWAGRPLLTEERTQLESLLRLLRDDGLGDQLSDLLTATEVDAIHDRLNRLMRTGRFPRPSPHWPAIPWPAF